MNQALDFVYGNGLITIPTTQNRHNRYPFSDIHNFAAVGVKFHRAQRFCRIGLSAESHVRGNVRKGSCTF